MTGWSAGLPLMINWCGRRIAAVLVANEIMASILKGELNRCLSSAPPDLSVCDARAHDEYTLVIYVESETFEPLDDRGIVPVLDVIMTQTWS